jgi:hypothetical protein
VNCYNHRDRPAIGSCKGCSKGLCAECAADLGLGLACRGVHELYVEQLNALIDKSLRASGSRIRRAFSTYIAAVMITLLGVAMIVSSARSDFDYLLEFFGGVTLMMMGLLYFWTMLLRNRSGEASSPPNA